MKHVIAQEPSQPGSWTICSRSLDDPANGDLEVYSEKEAIEQTDDAYNTEGWCETCIDKVPPRACFAACGPYELHDIAIEGRCIIVDEGDEYWANGREYQSYQSAVLVDPTWEDLVGIANEVIRTTADWHHVFLETLEERKEHELVVLAQALSGEDPPRVFTLGLGS